MRKTALVILTIIRWVVGLLFVFSGLIKAIDPLGLSYKMQEFFEAWNMQGWNAVALVFAIVMNLLEVFLGVAIIVGWKAKFFSRFLFLLILFFLFLTTYVLLSGKIKACGCFGDCIPLTPIQTFIKDVILCILIFILVLSHKHIQPYTDTLNSLGLLGFALVATMYIQNRSLKRLPMMDCLPYAIGKNILQEMQVPAHAIQDEYHYQFIYKMPDGKEVVYDENNLPSDIDSTYTFIGRTQVLYKKGNDVKPLISDFFLQSRSGTDTTMAILSQNKNYILMVVPTFPNKWIWQQRFDATAWQQWKQKGIPLFLVTADVDHPSLDTLSKMFTILFADATILKTMARATPTYFLMNAATIVKKYSYADVNKLVPITK